MHTFMNTFGNRSIFEMLNINDLQQEATCLNVETMTGQFSILFFLPLQDISFGQMKSTA